MAPRKKAATTLAQDLRELGRLRVAEKAVAQKHTDATDARKIHERAVYDRMESEGYENDDSVKLGGVVYTPRSTDFATVQDQSKLLEHLEETDAGLIERKTRKAELNRLVREALDNGSELPPGLGYYTETKIGTRGLTKGDDQEDIDDGDQG